MVLGLPRAIVRGLVPLDCRLRLLENYFCHFLKETALSFLASRTCLMPLSFAQSRKILSKFSKPSAI